MVVTRVRNGGAQQRSVLVHARDDRRKVEQEADVVLRRRARVEQVPPLVAAQRPVHVLTAAVDAGVGLLVQQAGKVVAVCDVAQHLHRQHVVVDRDVARLEDGGELELGWRHFVVAGLGRDAETPELSIDVFHERHDALANRPEVVIVQLLTLERRRTEQGPAGVDEVRALDEELFVDEEVLLLTADGREHPLDGFVTKQMRNLDRLPLQRLAGAHQRGLLVERLAGVGAEGRWDAQRATGRVALDEAAGLEGSQAV